MFCPRCEKEIGEDEDIFGRKDFVGTDSVDDILFIGMEIIGRNVNEQ